MRQPMQWLVDRGDQESTVCQSIGNRQHLRAVAGDAMLEYDDRPAVPAA